MPTTGEPAILDQRPAFRRKEHLKQGVQSVSEINHRKGSSEDSQRRAIDPTLWRKNEMNSFLGYLDSKSRRD